MADKRSYREIQASVETHLIYINNHLGNIDGHLEKINTINLAQEVKIAKNKTSIAWIKWIVGGGFTIITIAVVGTLKVMGVY